MNIYLCKVCSHVEFGSAPEKCPACQAPRESFERNDRLFIEAAEKGEGEGARHVPEVTVKQQCGLIPEEPCTDILVRIGKTLHPMEAQHAIVFIDCYVDDRYVARMSLTPDANPSAIFHLGTQGKSVRLVDFCNIHGHWQAQASIGMARAAGA